MCTFGSESSSNEKIAVCAAVREAGLIGACMGRTYIDTAPASSPFTIGDPKSGPSTLDRHIDIIISAIDADTMKTAKNESDHSQGRVMGDNTRQGSLYQRMIDEERAFLERAQSKGRSTRILESFCRHNAVIRNFLERMKTNREARRLSTACSVSRLAHLNSSGIFHRHSIQRSKIEKLASPSNDNARLFRDPQDPRETYLVIRWGRYEELKGRGKIRRLGSYGAKAVTRLSEGLRELQCTF